MIAHLAMEAIEVDLDLAEAEIEVVAEEEVDKLEKAIGSVRAAKTRILHGVMNATAVRSQSQMTVAQEVVAVDVEDLLEEVEVEVDTKIENGLEETSVVAVDQEALAEVDLCVDQVRAIAHQAATVNDRIKKSKRLLKD